MRSATTEETMDKGNACATSNARYGNSGMNPATKYAANMITAASTEPRVSSTPPSISSTEASERKLPAAMENASTKMSTTPVKNIVSRGTPAIAMPERSPTVETSPSSTPNTKLRKKSALRKAVVFISVSYHLSVLHFEHESSCYRPRIRTLWRGCGGEKRRREGNTHLFFIH